MSTLSQFGGGMPVTKAIVNRFSDNGWTGRASYAGQSAGGKSVLSGAMTANTLKAFVTVSGKGSVDVFAFETMDATGRTVRAKITIDGVVVLDSTSTSIAQASVGGYYIGTAGTDGINLDPVYFNQSLLIEMASSLTETDKLLVGYRYKTF